MQKKSEKFKIVKKDYNNELEEVLEKKYFTENAKSILLSILYKLEMSYKDYKQVKQDVEAKEKMIENVINNVKDNCNEIKLVKPNSEDSKILKGKNFLVDKNRKIIFCYPIERKLLYAISKISKKDRIIKEKYFLIDETLSDLINIGNNINTVEPLRDFNGYSWTTIPREIESIEYNLLYQNLIILIGNEFLDKWINNKEVMIDYMEKFIDLMDKTYGKRAANKFINNLENISILLEMKYDKDKKRKIVKAKYEIEEKLDEIGNNRTYIAKITKEKRKLENEIKYIDETINDKNKLQKEYNARNENLPLEKKIFSMRILSKMMQEERAEKMAKIENLNKLLNPQKFMEYKNDLIKKIKLLEFVETRDLEKDIYRLKLDIQKAFLECFKHKVKNINAKQDMLRLIYQFRYYTLIPFNYENTVREVEELKPLILEIEKLLLDKAHSMKIIEKLSKQEEVNYELLKCIFSTRSINLEEICIKLEKNKENYCVAVFDDNICEERYELSTANIMKKKDLYIRFNKKVRIFI